LALREKKFNQGSATLENISKRRASLKVTAHFKL